MLAIRVEFLTGRFHATPWGRAANEGDVEWPPSPWRLARAIVDAWYRIPPGDRPAIADVDAILAALSTPPRVLLPPATVGQSRHYMPLANHGPKNETRLVLDAFVRVADAGAATLVWDALALPRSALVILERLLADIGYLGRAESPVEITLTDSPPDGDVEARPLESDGEVPPRHDVVRTLVLDAGSGVEDLSVSTAELRRRRLSGAPGGAFVPYTVPDTALEARAPAPRRRSARRIEVVRFALRAAALPPITEALAVAELVRRSALSRVDDGDVDAVTRLRGRDPRREQPGEGHGHCHYLVTDEDGDGRIDHVTVWCPDGMGRTALDALDIHRLSSWRLDVPIHMIPIEVIDVGRRDGRPPPVSQGGPLARSSAWVSHTPFLPVRHPKRRSGRWLDCHADQVRLELHRRALPDPTRVEIIRSGHRHWGAYRRERRGGEPAVGAPAVGIGIEFAEPVAGPICLGRNSHFGMGLFLPSP